MNLPNKLTIIRILFVPIIVILFYCRNLTGMNAEFFSIPIANWMMMVIFAIASYTDHLDGKLARKNNQITTFGKFADPLADKILVLAAMLILVENGAIPAWIPIITIFREFVVSGYRLVAAEKGGKVIAANIWGKIKTFTQMIAILLAFLDIHHSNILGEFLKGNLTGAALIINILTTVFFILSTIATVFSGYQYLKDAKDLLKD